MFDDFVPCHKCRYYDTEKSYCSMFLMRKALGCPNGEEKKKMTISERIAVNAKELCKVKGLKLSALENAIGVHQGYLSRVRGKASMPVDKSYAISDWLEVPMEQLILPNAIRKQRIMELEAELERLKEEDNAE